VKFTPEGSLIYEKNDGGSGDEEAREVTEDLSGICALIGYTTSYGAGDQSITLHRFNSSGWWVSSPVYGLEFEDGYSVDYTHDNGYIIAGITNGYDVSNFDALIIKTDINGQTGTTGDVENITDNLVSIDEFIQEDVGFYIGYAGTSLTVNSTEIAISNVAIINLLGQEIINQSFSGRRNMVQMDVSSAPNGIYVVAIELQNSSSRISKICVSY